MSGRLGVVEDRRPEPFRITTATQSHSDDIGHRQRRYLISMVIRTACFLLAVVFGLGLLDAVHYGALLVTGAYWYGRNLMHAGNPLPLLQALGPIDLPGPEQMQLFRNSGLGVFPGITASDPDSRSVGQGAGEFAPQCLRKAAQREFCRAVRDETGVADGAEGGAEAQDRGRRERAGLIRSTLIAALGSMHDGVPFLEIVSYAFSDDFSAALSAVCLSACAAAGAAAALALVLTVSAAAVCLD